MPLPKSLARFNRRVTNRVLGPMAAWLPGFAVVEHVGRRTGRRRHSPVNLFRAEDRYVIALTYGADAQWVRNVVAAGGCAVRTRGRRIELVAPEVVRDPRRALVPAPVAWILGAIDVDDFMLLRLRAGAADPP
jgi:deazaflavin-dependent oxidoreductase (nitroreductase family)